MSATILHFGGGTNSAAMGVGLVERGERPDAITFADTGGEKPETYQFVLIMSDWFEKQGFPRIQTVKYRTRNGVELDLEEDCLIRKALPSIAYGFKSCSQRWKARPQDYFVRDWPLAQETWKSGGRVTKLIGFDAGESHRAKPFSDNKFHVRYPLIEWGWDRDDCIAAIQRAGLPLPGKSSCFFCPSMKKAEVAELAVKHPGLYQRAVNMENNADLSSIKGLGRRWAWRDLPTYSEPEIQLELPCDCWDGASA